MAHKDEYDIHFEGDPTDVGDKPQYQRMLDGEWFKSYVPEIIADGTRAAEILARHPAAHTTSFEAAMELYGELFAEVGDWAMFNPPLYVDVGKRTRIGTGVFANYGLTMLDTGGITIGDDCLFGPHVQLLTTTHPLESRLRTMHIIKAEPITLGDRVWVGAGAIIMGGVTIGDDAVIGAGAVVTKDVPAAVVAVGNPARVQRDI